MKKLIKNLIFSAGVLSILTSESFAAQFVISSVGVSQATLGTGYRMDEESWAEECVKGKTIYTGRPEANLSFSSKVQQSRLAKELGFDAGMKAKWGAATVSAAANFLNSSKESSHSIVAVYKGDYVMKNAYLTDVTDDGSKFDANKRLRPDCGEAYVKAIGRGAKLFFSIRIDFISEQQKRKFAASASYSSTAFSIRAAIKNSRESFDTSSKVTVQAYQLGGDVRNLSHIFGSRTKIENSGDKETLPFVSCSFGNFDDCDAALDEALKYAQGSFPEQLKTNENDPDLGPANLYYILQPYEGHSPAVNTALRATRKTLEDILNEQTEILGLANNATKNRVYPLAPDQAREAEKILDDVMSNILRLKDLADECYNHIGTCANNAAIAREELKPIANKKLYFPPRSFLQYCGIGYYMSPEENGALRETIYTMLAVAEKINPIPFGKQTNQGLNKCEAAFDIFKQQSAFDISLLNNAAGNYTIGTHIHVLEPFQDLGHFEYVNLEGQKLESTNGLSYFTLAHKIDLSNNKIRTLTDLSKMKNLKDFSIGGNFIRDLSAIGSPPELVRLDIRNSIVPMDCPTLDTLRVCVRKSYNGRVASTIVGEDLPRSFFRPAVVQLQNGNILMTSGASSIVYNPITHAKLVAPKMNFARSAHTATLLDDGRVLLIGGQGGQTSVELYNPAQNKFSVVTNQAPSRTAHAALKLPDGRVVVTGGYEFEGQTFQFRPITTISVYDPKSNRVENVGHMMVARASHTMTLMEDGRILIIGGYSKSGGHRMTEILDPSTMRTTVFAPLNEGRYGHTTSVLKDGRILIVGGLREEGAPIKTLEFFDPERGAFEFSYEQMKTPRAFHTTTVTENNELIITGGSSNFYDLLNGELHNASEMCSPKIEIYNADEQTFTDMGQIQLNYARAMHSAVSFQPGMIFLIGGSDAFSANTIELISYSSPQATRPN